LSAVQAVWPHPVLDRLGREHSEIAHPVAVGAAAAAHGLPLIATAQAFVQAFAANLVSAGVRLIPIGQTDGLRVIAALEPLSPSIVAAALAASLDDIGSAAIQADIASMRHETQYTRLFRS
jgi:urease accessory protein